MTDVADVADSTRRSDDAAFTLAELLVVVVVIAVLVAGAVPVLRGARERAALGQTKSDVRAAASVVASLSAVLGSLVTDPNVLAQNDNAFIWVTGAPVGSQIGIVGNGFRAALVGRPKNVAAAATAGCFALFLSQFAKTAVNESSPCTPQTALDSYNYSIKGSMGMLPNGDVYFVKRLNVASGYIEAHLVTAASGWTTPSGQTPTRFPVSIDNSGTFGMNSANDVWFVMQRGTGSGKIELHTATAASGYTTGVSVATRFNESEGGNGTFGVLANGDVWYLKRHATGSGFVELHTATAASGWTSGNSVATWITTADADNGTFGLTSSNDVYFVKQFNAVSGTIELHTATTASGYATGLHTTTWVTPADGYNGSFSMTAGGDLVFIKQFNTVSGTIELHTATAASGYTTGVHATTWFSAYDATN